MEEIATKSTKDSKGGLKKWTLAKIAKQRKDFGFSVVIYLKDAFPKIEGEFGEAQGSYGQGVVVEIEMGLVQ